MLCLYVSSVLHANKRQNIVTWLNICPRACQISCRLPVSECIHATVAFFCSATCQTILRIGETHVKTRNVKLMFDMSSPQVIHFLLRDCHSATALQRPGGYYIMNPRVHAIAAQLDLCRSVLLHFLPDPAECWGHLRYLRWSCGTVWHPIASHGIPSPRQQLDRLGGSLLAWPLCGFSALGREENGDELRTDKTNIDQHPMIISWSQQCPWAEPWRQCSQVVCISLSTALSTYQPIPYTCLLSLCLSVLHPSCLYVYFIVYCCISTGAYIR